jgi:hypothetical protein
VTPGQVIPVSIGAGGASGGGVSGFGTAAGADGQDTTFGTFCTGAGGKGGRIGAVADSIALSTVSVGGAGGTGSGIGADLIVVPGETGTDGPLLDDCVNTSDWQKNKNINGMIFGGSSMRGFSIGQGGRGGNAGANWVYQDANVQDNSIIIPGFKYNIPYEIEILASEDASFRGINTYTNNTSFQYYK